jgi:hypothetical protein
VIWIIGTVCMLVGLLGYTGLWRAWAKDGRSYWVLGLFWFGFGVVLMSVVLAMPDRPGWLFWVPAVITLLGAASTWYLPPTLTPPWFRALRRSWR